MKRALLVFGCLLMLPALSEAQEVYSVSANAIQVAIVQQWTAFLNRDNCRRINAAGGAACTQAQACTAVNAPGGSGCSPAQARQAGVRIWPDSQAGREEYMLHGVAAPALADIKAKLPASIVIDKCIWWNGQNTTVQNAECATIGAPPGCSPCP